MAELKTKKNAGNVMAFIESVTDESKRADCLALLKLMKKITKAQPAMWGDSVVGFDSFHYKSERSQQKGDWYISGFSPRKQNLTIYIIPGFASYGDIMKKLGKYKTSGSCLHIKKLADIDMAVLQQLVSQSFKDMKEKYKK